jgi:uncharacterized protein
MRVTCPTCRHATTWEENAHRPFCSERCRNIDLGLWAAEAHRIPGEPALDAAPDAPEDRTADPDPSQNDRPDAQHGGAL